MRLIDADQISRYRFLLTPSRYYKGWNCGIDYVFKNAPTIDAVPVVRCGECKLFDKTGYEDDNANEDDSTLHMGYCRVWSRNTQACCFCSHGERSND